MNNEVAKASAVDRERGLNLASNPTIPKSGTARSEA